jgi:hypothetical protein
LVLAYEGFVHRRHVVPAEVIGRCNIWLGQ